MKLGLNQWGGRACLVAACSSALTVLLSACSPPPKTEAPVRAVRTLVISESGGMLDREFSGEIKARVESRLSFRVPGKVISRQVELGQSVKARPVPER